MTVPKTGRTPDPEFLSAESRSKIEDEFDNSSRQIGLWFLAALHHLKRLVAVLLGLLAAVYICDYTSVRYGIPSNREALGTVEVQRYYAVRLKSGKTEITYDGSENQVCTNSIFPHLGYDPCWYVRKHTRKMIDI